MLQQVFVIIFVQQELYQGPGARPPTRVKTSQKKWAAMLHWHFRKSSAPLLEKFLEPLLSRAANSNQNVPFRPSWLIEYIAAYTDNKKYYCNNSWTNQKIVKQWTLIRSPLVRLWPPPDPCSEFIQRMWVFFPLLLKGDILFSEQSSQIRQITDTTCSWYMLY